MRNSLRSVYFPRWGSSQLSPDPKLDLRGLLLRGGEGRGEEGKKRGKWRMREKKGKGGNREGGNGMGRGKGGRGEKKGREGRERGRKEGKGGKEGEERGDGRGGEGKDGAEPPLTFFWHTGL